MFFIVCGVLYVCKRLKGSVLSFILFFKICRIVSLWIV